MSFRRWNDLAIVGAVSLTVGSLSGCADRVSTLGPQMEMRASTQELTADTKGARVFRNPDSLGAEISKLGMSNEILVWLKPVDQPRISVDVIQDAGSARAVVGLGMSDSDPHGRNSFNVGRINEATKASFLRVLEAHELEPSWIATSFPVLSVRIPQEKMASFLSGILNHPAVDFVEGVMRQPAFPTASPIGTNTMGTQHSIHFVSGAWDHTRGSGATIGVLDSGLAGNVGEGTWHPDAQDFGTYGITPLGFVDDGGSCNSTQQAQGQCLANDDHGHGTQMAGLVGANDNNLGSLGIAPQAKVYSMKIAFNADRSGLTCGVFPWGDDSYCIESEDFIAGLDWASSNGIDVLSMSFAAGLTPSEVAAVSYAYNSHDILLLSALGNNASESDDLVSLAWVMGVGGVWNDYTLAQTVRLNYYEIGGYASGSTLKATCASGSICTVNPTDLWANSSGTSAATANVAAIAALLRTAAPGLTNAQARARLISTASGAEYPVADAEWAVENVTKVTVGRSGPVEIPSPGNYTWQASASGGLGSYSYLWERQAAGSSTWTYVATGANLTLGIQESDPNFTLRVTASSYGRRARNQIFVEVCMDDCPA